MSEEVKERTIKKSAIVVPATKVPMQPKPEEKITISFDEYDALFDRIEKMPKSTYIPTILDLKRVKAFFKEYYKFAIYLSEWHEDVENPEDQVYLNALKTIVREKLILE